MDIILETTQHGDAGFRIGTYSEKRYGASYRFHEEYELLYVAEGTLNIGIDGTAYSAKAPAVFFIDRNRPHYVDITAAQLKGSFHWYAILFHASVLGEKNDRCRRFPEINEIDTLLPPDDIYLKLIPAIQELSWSSETGYEYECKAMLLNIMAHIQKTGRYKKRTEKTYSNAFSAVNSVVRYISENFCESFKISDLAAMHGYSPNHLSGIFKRYTGESITQFAINARVRAACGMLADTDKTIAEVAVSCGFDNISYFNRTFLKKIGVTPGCYRTAAQNNDNNKRL